ncbi:MAG TPA: HlyD family secretion protein [Ideonella sp.]|uniref:HlyD family secretion protein n=1 Tax=Ideonella sp. TaxID=1929293 RepID=UPI002BF84C03|nr:HlyD family secretion protein [Ideonella sp.]HSI48584.1 HlyD family secretion protein [Ideonella sp.]
MSTPDQPKPAAASKPPRKMRGRVVAWVFGLGALLAGGAWGLHWWQVGRFIESTDDAYLKADAVVVTPKVGGYVAEVLVQANQVVQQGTPLVRLDRRQYEALFDQAKAQLEAREADLQRVKAELVQQQAQIEQAQAQETVARLAEHHAHDEVERYAPLVTTGAATDERLAELRNTLAQAQANLVSASAALKAARSKLGTSQAQVAQAEAQSRAAEASRRQSTLDVDDTLLRSAQAGRVGDLSVRVGQFAQPGTRLMSIVPVQQTYLVANFKETQIGRMQAGQPVQLHVDAWPGETLRGVVESFSPGTGAQFALLPPENATGNFTKIVQRVPVRIRLDLDTRQRARLLPGLSVTADVDTRGAADHG